MHIVTGGAGFIGSAFVWKLNQQGIEKILVVDALDTTEKWKNLRQLRFADYMDRKEFLARIAEDRLGFNAGSLVHMGACSSTTERDAAYLMENNYGYTRDLAHWAVRKNIRFIYASSAATYGDGEQGFSDDDETCRNLVPQNMYGYSKQIFDLWAMREGLLDRICGLKFFNVYGPNEYHKGEMSSVVFKAFHQVNESGRIRLFRSYRPEYGDGMQKRDFIYVKDAVEIMWWLLEQRNVNGIYNVGTGEARTWVDLARAVFAAMNRPAEIEFIDMPESIRDRYQYLTQATVSRLRNTGCPLNFTTLEEAVRDYITGYLARPLPYLSA